MVKQSTDKTELRAVTAGILAWLLPGLGHFFLRQHWRGAVFLAVICTTFWSGVAIGGVHSTVDPLHHRAWFVAEICAGGNVIGGLLLRSRLPDIEPGAHSPYLAVWPSDDVGIVYCGVAGLLNILVILDAVARGAPAARAGARTATRRGGGG